MKFFFDIALVILFIASLVFTQNRNKNLSLSTATKQEAYVRPQPQNETKTNADLNDLPKTNFSLNATENSTANENTVSALQIPDSLNNDILKDSLLDIKIGQLIMFGIYGTSVNQNSEIVKAIKNNLVGGILLYERNISPQNSMATLKKLNDDLQSYSKTKLFISIDQEGGIVNRLKSKYGFPEMASAYEIGRKNDSAFTVKQNYNIALSCKKVSINVNYAPVVDIHKPNNPVLGARMRCYSSSPEKVAYFAKQCVDAHRQMNVLTVLKHFPGHGSSTKDSHKGVVDVSKTWQPNELLPYKEMIDENEVDMIMTAHIINNKLEKQKIPATLSKTIIQGLLRDSLKYNGVVISDDLQMKAISNFYNFRTAVKMALNAGVDILMFSNNIDGVGSTTPAKIHSLIKDLIIKKEVSMNRINQSYQRVMDLKTNFIAKEELLNRPAGY